MDKRPNLDKNISVKDFRDFYWLKGELVDFCRIENLKKSGGKMEIAERIENYLRTGKKEIKAIKTERVKRSNFDWNTEQLTLETKITNSYKNSENVRIFFKSQIGAGFKFNVQFMNWMKANSGKKLEQAVEEWKRIEQAKKNNTKPKEIALQFEYNRYLRDFLADNPGESRERGIALWKVKKSMRGENGYDSGDLELL